MNERSFIKNNLKYLKSRKLTTRYQRVQAFIKNRSKLNKLFLDLKFLMRCKEEELTPKFLQIKIEKYPRSLRNILETAEVKMVRSTIRSKRNAIKAKEFECYYQHILLTGELKPAGMEALLAEINENNESEESAIIKRHEAKIQSLKRRKKKSTKKCEEIESIPIINLSSRIMKKEELEVLGKGPKYSHQKEIDLRSIIPQIEAALDGVPVEKREKVRNNFVFAIQKEKAREKCKRSKKDQEVKRELKILKNLKSDTSIRIVEADKSKQIVILDTKDFNEKKKQTVSEINAVVMQKDPTDTLYTKVQKLCKQNQPNPPPFKINSVLYPAPPKLFVKLKTHQKNHPLRPIVTKINSPTYNLEKEIAKMLKPMIENHEYAVQSGIEVLEKLKKLEISKNDRLYSIDVVALYPSVPMDKAKKLIMSKMKEFPDINKHRKFVEKAINLIFQNNYFQVNGIIYKQTTGSPLGSPLSVIVAELILQDIEKKVFKRTMLKPTCYYRYVDDSIVIWQFGEEKMLELCNEMSSVYETINFTIEKENNKTIPFLDLKITRGYGNKMYFDVYKKPTSMDCPIPAGSEHPTETKMAFFRSHQNRNKAYTTFDFQEKKNNKQLKKIAQKAGYDDQFIKEIFREERQKVHREARREKQTEGHSYTTAIDYNKCLVPVVKYAKKKFQINIPFKASSTIIEKVKSDRDKTKLACGVYSIPLKQGMEHKYYIGQTARPVRKRLTEHKNSLKDAGNNTSLKKFVLDNNNVNPEWERTKILAAPRNRRELEWREGIEILMCQKAINTEPGRTIPGIWRSILDK